MRHSARKRRLATALSLMAAVAVLGAGTAMAGHSFLDTPDDHTFHGDIEWMKDHGITRGCNPPANTNYCPDENTTRGQMAAFFKRFAESRAVDAGLLDGMDSSEFLTRDEIDELGGVPGPQGPQGPQGEPGSFSSENITVREASESEGNLIVVGNTYTAMCEAGEVAIGGGYETEFTLLGPAVDGLLGPLSGALGLVGLGDIGNLGDTLDGVSNVNVHSNGPAAGGDGWAIGTTINLASDITVRAVCAG